MTTFQEGQDVFVSDKDKFRYSMGGGLDGTIKRVNQDNTCDVLLNFRGDAFLMTHIPKEKIRLVSEEDELEHNAIADFGDK